LSRRIRKTHGGEHRMTASQALNSRKSLRALY
jgi:hypothetical protein